VYRSAAVSRRRDQPEALASLVEQAKNTIFGSCTTFLGRTCPQMTIFALGIMPYISASIILQLLTVVWPYLERLSKEASSAGARYAVHALRDDSS
jgi:preprotein translocase subunit SecY